MAPKPFGATTRRVNGAAVIDLSGDLNGLAETPLNAAYAEAVAGEPAVVVLNFSAVEYINSTGIALIVGLLAQARKARRPLAVYGLSDHYRQIFEITRLADFMRIAPDEAGAVAPVQ